MGPILVPKYSLASVKKYEAYTVCRSLFIFVCVPPSLLDTWPGYPSGLILTLFGPSSVATRSSVGRVLGVPCGGAVSRPVKLVVLVLNEQADRFLLKAAVKLTC